VRILVTGATGEIGGSLLERLVKRGGEVRVLTRSGMDGREQPEEGPVNWVRGDLTEPGSLAPALEGIDLVLHMAAVTHTRHAARYWETNATGTANLLAAAEAAGVERFLHISTRALGEEGGPYCHSKAVAEERVRASSIPSVILRPGEVYGSGGRDPILDIARSLARRSFVTILGDGGQLFCPVHVDDVVGAIVRALDAPGLDAPAYTVAGPEEMRYVELVGRLERALGLGPRRRIHIPVAVARLGIAVASRLGIGSLVPDQLPRLLLAKSSDVSDAVRDLDFAPRSLEEGVEPLLASLRRR
jgi:nucleoside-diphosphate-sugar epimerase